jgi:hypothetical protein
MKAGKIANIIFPWENKLRAAIILGFCALAGLIIGIFGFPTQSIDTATYICEQGVNGDCEKYSETNIKPVNSILNTGLWYLFFISGMKGLKRWKS